MAETKIPNKDLTAMQLRAQYPSNSKLNKPDAKPEKEPMTAVANGVITDRKNGVFKRVIKMFIAEDVHDIGRYLLEDVMVPGIKMAVISSLDRLFFARGSSGYSPYYRPYDYANKGRQTHSAYYYGAKSSQPQAPSAADLPRSPSGLKYITYLTRSDADGVLNEMNARILQYGEVTVRDYYEASNVDSDFTDENWGWKSLRGAHCYPVKGGYALELPPTEILE